MYYIYKIENLTNALCYIGFTENPKKRWNQHCWSMNSPLHKAMREFGKESFSVIASSPDKLYTLNTLEKKYVKQYDSYHNGYNRTRGGGWADNDEARANASTRMKNNNPMSVLRTNSGSFKLGHKPTITLERNEKIRVSKIGSKNPMYGNKHAADHLNKSTYTCEYCPIITTKGNIARWHGNNCKFL